MEQKKLYPNEVIIDKIDPVVGVTPEQLIEFLKKITYTIKVAAKLNQIEIMDAIHYTTIAVLGKMNEGVVPKYNFHDFKDYLFISFRNFLYQRMDRRMTQKNIPNSTKFDFNQTIPDDYLVIDPYIQIEERLDKYDFTDEFNNLLKTLTPFEFEAIRRVMNGEKAKRVSRSIGRSSGYVYSIITRLKGLAKPKQESEPRINSVKKHRNREINKEYLQTLADNYNEVYDSISTMPSLHERIQYLFNNNFNKYQIKCILNCSLSTINHHQNQYGNI